jgi:putative ABC transport system permease protein
MSLLHDLVERLRALVFRGREDRELDEELRFHLEMEAEQQERTGASADEARRLSAIALGGIEQTKDRVRDARGTRWLEDFATDVRMAIRAIRRAPGFAALAVAMLAIGIGANTTIFALIDAVVVRSLPVPHAEQLVVIGDPSMVNSIGSGSPMTRSISYPLYRDIRDHGGPLSGVLASGSTQRLDVRIENSASEPEHPQGRFVSGNYFSVLEVPAWRGRVFDATEDQTIAGSPVAAISHGYWTRRFHQDDSVVGRSILVNNARLTIVGVTPPSFTGEVVGESTDIWVPITMRDVLKPQQRALDRRNKFWLLILGRLAPGVTLEQARADLAPFIIRTIAANAPGRQGQEFLDRRPEVPIASGRRGLSDVRDTFQTPLLTLMAGVGLLLCIICANVANLLLARAISRGKEMAVRLALGAGRGRLVRLLLTESLLLALLGGVTGLLIAWWGSGALLILAADGDPIAIDLSLSGRALLFTFAVSFAAVALFGLAPALRASRTEPIATLRAGARTVVGGGFGRRGRRTPLGGLLIAGQVALSVVLLVGTAMLARSLRNVQSVEVGMDRDHLVILNVDIDTGGYRGERLAQLTHAIRDRIAAMPDVIAVGFSENGIFSGTDWHSEISIPGRPFREEADARIATDSVGPGYVRAIGGRLLSGRDIDASDEGHALRTAVVNQSFASFYFPNEDAVGRSFMLDELPIEIVGVMADTRDHALDRPAGRRAYFPYVPTDKVSNPEALRFAIRAADPLAIIQPVRRAVAEIDSLLPIDSINPLTTLMRQSIREERLVAQLASAFGILALLLASIGLYGVMTYAVRRRASEIGLRSALGAARSSILQMVLGEALRLVAAGMIAGVLLALAVTQSLGAQLHGVPAIDPISIAVALSILGASAITAALLPAVSASRVSPIVALQAD